MILRQFPTIKFSHFRENYQIRAPDVMAHAPTHLQGFDLVLEAVDVLLRDLLAGDLPLDPLEPAVQIVEVLPGLAELLLHGLLKGRRKIRALEMAFGGELTGSVSLLKASIKSPIKVTCVELACMHLSYLKATKNTRCNA